MGAALTAFGWIISQIFELKKKKEERRLKLAEMSYQFHKESFLKYLYSLTDLYNAVRVGEITQNKLTEYLSYKEELLLVSNSESIEQEVNKVNNKLMILRDETLDYLRNGKNPNQFPEYCKKVDDFLFSRDDMRKMFSQHLNALLNTAATS